MKGKNLITKFLIIILVVALITITFMYFDMRKQAEENLESIFNVADELYETNERINELEDRIAKLEVEDEVSIDNYSNAENDNNGFNTGIYSYDYVEKMEEGMETEWELELSMGFSFLSNGIVYGFLPGHESGSLVGTYEISDEEIKCKFTECENESAALYGVKLEQEGEVVLKRVNQNELSITNWAKNPMLDGEDLSYGENQIFKLNFRENN